MNNKNISKSSIVNAVTTEKLAQYLGKLHLKHKVVGASPTFPIGFPSFYDVKTKIG